MALACWIYMAYLFGEAAKEKGYEGAKYYVVPFLFTFAGFLWIIALPDRRAKTVIVPTAVPVAKEKQEAADELPDL